MTLDKAIEILKDSIADNTLLITLEHDQAVKLGIEALKAIKDVRPTDYGAIDDLLLGETSS